MRKLFCFLGIILVSISITFADSSGDKNELKFLTIISDWGDEEIPYEIIETLQGCSNIKLTIPWSEKVTPFEEIKSLVYEGKIEPVMTLIDEPVLPVIFETKLSKPVKIEFSWPEDIRDIIYMNQQEFSSMWGTVGSGLYLRSGIFSERLIYELRNLGLSWVNYKHERNLTKRVYVKDSFLMLGTENKKIKKVEKCLTWIKSSKNKFMTLVFSENRPVKAEFLAQLSEELEKQQNIKMILPKEIIYEQNSEETDSSNEFVFSDLSDYYQRPIVWYRIYQVKQLVKEYESSGKAHARILEAVNDEIYHLYRYDFIRKLQRNPSPKEKRIFQAGLANIYRLLKRKIPPDLSNPFELNGKVQEEIASFSIKNNDNQLIISNSFSELENQIKEFIVEKTGSQVKYVINFSSDYSKENLRIDIYIDLNNRRGAGLTKLLPNINAFLDPKNAWEYAIQIKGQQVSFFRSVGYKSTLVSTHYSREQFSAAIPASKLRGNPFGWGYQVVVSSRSQGTGQWIVNDFLSSDASLKPKILMTKPVVLPVIRKVSYNSYKKK